MGSQLEVQSPAVLVLDSQAVSAIEAVPFYVPESAPLGRANKIKIYVRSYVDAVQMT